MKSSKNKSTSRKNLILKKAASLFQKKGYTATNIREVAKKCGIKGGSMYYHFSAKQDILFQIMTQTMSNLITNLKEAIRDEENSYKRLKKAIHFHIKYHIDNPNETRVTDGELRSLSKPNYKAIVKARREYEAIFRDILRDGIRDNDFEIDNLEIASIAILQMCTGVQYWFKKNGYLSRYEIAELHANLICWGIANKNKAK